MPEVTKEEIERAWKLLNEGKEEEPLKLATEIERKEDLSLEEKLKIQILKANIHYSLGHFKKFYKITSFSNEFFAEGLDRAIFGQYTVLMETISKYSICYLYKGQTYLAKKKLEYFIERLQNVPSIMQTLDKFSETSQVIELKNFPFLEGFITEIFASKNPVLEDIK